VSEKKSRLRSILIATTATTIGILTSLALIEVIVRIVFDEPVRPRFVIDPGYGVRANQPNVSTRHYVPGEYSVTISTNSSGMRSSREYELRKPTDVRRVLMLGDSFAFGFGVEDDEVISAVLEHLLNAQNNDGQKFEVINLSVSGSGQAEQLVTYRELGRKYDADVVVLLYYDNDIGNNAVAALFELNDQGRVTRMDTEYLPAVKLREKLYGVAPIRWLFTNSEAWNLVRNRLSRLVQQSLLRKQGMKKFTELKPEAVELTRGLLRQFIADIQSDNAKPIIVVIPDGHNMTSNFPLAADQIDVLGATLVDDLKYLDRSDYFVRDIHWRPSGHLKTAQALKSLVSN